MGIKHFARRDSLCPGRADIFRVHFFERNSAIKANAPAQAAKNTYKDWQRRNKCRKPPVSHGIVVLIPSHSRTSSTSGFLALRPLRYFVTALLSSNNYFY